MGNHVDIHDPVRERLLGLLAAGVSQTVAAAAVGVTDAYVSQLLDSQEFRDALSLKRVARLEQSVEHDDTIESAEKKALDTVVSKLPFVRSATEAARIFQILNSAKRRNSQDVDKTPEQLQQVAIVLPKAAQVHIQVNTLNQVIDVAGRSMAPLPSSALPALAASRSKDAERAEQLLSQVEKQPTTVIGGVVRVL